MHPLLRRLALGGADALCRLPLVREAASATAARRGRALVLVYHRVSAEPSVIVPVVSPALLSAQLDALRTVADIVPLDEVLRRFEYPAAPSHVRPLAAITFDDDDPRHVATTLPILEAHGVRATFFVSGRALQGLPPYWWLLLDEAIRAHGLDAVGQAIGVTGHAADLARACEDPVVAERLREWFPDSSEPVLQGDGIRALADAGMTIGFHTVRHPVLPAVSDDALDAELTDGLDEVCRSAGVSIDTIAFPHGCADDRVARAARRNGYRAGFVTGGRAVTSRSDRFRIPRWEPGPIGPTALVAEALLRLLGTVSPHGGHF